MKLHNTKSKINKVLKGLKLNIHQNVIVLLTKHNAENDSEFIRVPFM